MDVKCPKCHSENPETQRFCGECGTKLDISGKAPEAKATPSGPKDQISVTKTIEISTDGLVRGALLAGRYEIKTARKIRHANVCGMFDLQIGYVHYSYANLGIMGEENGKKAEIFAKKALD